MDEGPPLRSIVWGLVTFVACGFPSAVQAGGLDGSSIPSAGGGFAGPGDPGARGAIYHPAAIGRGEAPELLIDLGVFYQELRTALDDLGPPEGAGTFELQPSAAISIPFGDFALGGFVHGPYVRGSDGDPEGPRRFLGIASNLQLIEGAVLGSATVFDRLTLAGGVRIGAASFRSDTAIDFGYFVNDQLGLQDMAYPLPVGNPLWEGQQRVGPLNGTGLSWIAGASVELPGDVLLHGSFRPSWTVPVGGPFQLLPSNDLTLSLDGDASVALRFPWRAMFAATVPIGRLTLLPEVEVIGWNSAADIPVTIDGLAVNSSNLEFDLLIESAGLDEPAVLSAASGEQLIELGWRTIVNPGLQAEFALTDAVDLRGGFFWGRTAVPDAVVTPSNVDFETFIVRAGAAWQPVRRGRWFRLSGTVEAFPSPVRVITGTVPANPTVPSGNGRYQLVLWRAGLTTQFFIPNRSFKRDAP